MSPPHMQPKRKYTQTSHRYSCLQKAFPSTPDGVFGARYFRGNGSNRLTAEGPRGTFFFQTLFLMRAVPFPPPFPFGRRVRPLPCEMMFQICDQTCVTRYDVVNVHATTVSEGQRSIKLTHSHHSDTSTDSYTKTSRHSRISNKGTE